MSAKKTNNKTTIYDVADYLGVSTATINRVLNNNTNVKPETRKKVLDAVEKLGYRPSRAAASLNRKRIKMTFIIKCPTDPFIADVVKGAESAFADLQDFNCNGEIMLLSPRPSQKEYLDAMKAAVENGTDALLLVYPDENTISKTAIEDAASTGVKVAVGLTRIDTPGNLYNLQLDGIQAGHMAAELLEDLLNPGDKVAMITGDHNNSEHNATMQGFTKYMDHSGLDFVGIFEHDDNPEISVWLANKFIAQHPDIKGLYFGTGISVDFINVLVKKGYAGKIKIIASDIFPELSELMDKRIVNAALLKKPLQTGKQLVNEMFEHLAYGKQFKKKFNYLEPMILVNSNKKNYINTDFANEMMENEND